MFNFNAFIVNNNTLDLSEVIKKEKIHDIFFTHIQELADFLLAHPEITTLDLSQNDLNPADAKLLAHALNQTHTITNLDLAFNKIGEKGAVAVARFTI